MKNKEKIIGSIVILCISIIFIIAGYKMSGPKESINASSYSDIFVETDKARAESDAKGLSVSKSSIGLKTNTVGKSSTTIKSNAVAESNAVENTRIKVDIKGAVKAPGVYEIESECRVSDLIKLAGGATIDADLDATNLSKKLSDEDCIVIYKIGAVDKLQNSQSKSSTVTVPSTTTANSIININTATKEELKTLTGIGDVKADGIIKYREENGGFKSAEELTNVDGIGEKTLSKFIDKVDIK